MDACCPVLPPGPWPPARGTMCVTLSSPLASMLTWQQQFCGRQQQQQQQQLSCAQASDVRLLLFHHKH
jgi:hypothetical protein